MTSIKDLDFSWYQHLIMWRLKYFKIKKDKIRSNHQYDFLSTYYLIDYYRKDHSYYVLNEKGRMYLRYKRRDKLRFWIPVVISIIALLGGYDVYTIPILEQVLQGLTSILKTIMENLGAFF